jgi:hypothetical protein
MKQNAITNLTSYCLPNGPFKKTLGKKKLPHEEITSIIFLKMNFLEYMDIPPTKKINDKKGKMDFKISLRKWKNWPTKKIM